MIRIISSLFPKKLKEAYEKALNYNNILTNVDHYITFVTVFSIVISFLVALLIRIFVDFSFIITFIAGIVLVHSVVYAYLVLSADALARFVESILPDMLQLMAANLRAGLTVDRALLLSARPEFGHFQDEINRVGKEIATGKAFEESLMSMASRFRSEKLIKTAQLISTGVASGGQIADLLEHSASNLRQQQVNEQKVRSSVLTYVIFIFSAIAFGGPVLFGLSSFLIEVITEIFSKIELPPATVTAQLPLSFSKVQITTSFVNTYTITAMILTSIMGSLTLGLISKGEEKEGLKFIPILILLSISLFFLVKYIISSLLSGLLNF